MKKLTKLQRKIKKVAYNSPLSEVNENCFLLDYNACGNDMTLFKKLELLEKMIKKYFNVTYECGYLGIRELRFKTN